MVEGGVSWKGVWTVFQLQLGNWSRSKRAKLTFCVYNNASSIVLHNVKLDGRPLTLTHDTDKNQVRARARGNVWVGTGEELIRTWKHEKKTHLSMPAISAVSAQLGVHSPLCSCIYLFKSWCCFRSHLTVYIASGSLAPLIISNHR